MNMRKVLAITLLAASAALTGCGGGGAGSLTPAGTIGGNGGNGGSAPQSQQSQSENAISGANAMGSSLKNFATYTESTSGLLSVGRAPEAQRQALGTCNNGIEFFAPDKNGDPNSTQTQYFYDTACTNLARDVVRIFTPISSNAETISRTVKIYALGNSTPSAVRAESATYTNATFGSNGFPSATAGFDRVDNAQLDLSGVKTIDSSAEIVMQAANNCVSTFCSDSAGFNATGIQKLNETFGWSGGVLGGGTRTVNSDGTVTWSATHAGTTFKGAIGDLSINSGVQNTACPITTPMFTLSGGTQLGSYSIPMTATYNHGLLVNLSIQNAQLANGNTLNVTTNTSVSPTNDLFITGSVSNNGTQIASFNVNGFGDGTLTVTSSGAQYVITDWHVIK